MWTLLQPDYAHSGGDRTAGDDDALASAANELRYLGGETRKLFCVERVGARPSENAGAELEENAPGFSGHAELLSKSENESAQKQFPRFYQTAIIPATEISGEPGCLRQNSPLSEIACLLLRFHHVARLIVNANYRVVRTGALVRPFSLR